MSDSKLLSADELDAMNAICAMFTHDCASTINPPVRNNPMSDSKLSADAFNVMKAATNGNVFTPAQLAERWNGSGQNRQWEEISDTDRLAWAQQQAILADRADYKRLQPLLYAAGDGHQISREEFLGQPIWVAREVPGGDLVGIGHPTARACYDALTERQLRDWQRVNTTPTTKGKP